MTIQTVTPATFRTAYKQAQPGDVLRLASGNYGALTLRRRFPDVRPLTIQGSLGTTCTRLMLGYGHVINNVIVVAAAQPTD